MTPAFDARIEQALQQRRNDHLLRETTVLPRDGMALNDGQYLNFSSNDYLGLSQEPSVIEAWQRGLRLYGTGSGGSPLVTGHYPAHQSLIDTLCDWLGFADALLFSSGFAANHAVLSSLLQSEDTVFQDKLNHASLLDGGLHSSGKWRRFAHNDVADLSQKLAQCSSEGKLVVTEGVFSMDGDQAPLRAIQDVAQTHQAWLMVDDAHGIGVLGDQGRGSCQVAKIHPDILVITFGKAFGVQGAAVLCSRSVASYLRQFARHWIYSTAMPPAQAVAIEQACRCVQNQSWRRERLFEHSERVNHAISAIVPTQTSIKPILIGDSANALALSQRLKEKGIWLSAIRPPTVPKNGARLRLTLSATHSSSDISTLIGALQEVMDV